MHKFDLRILAWAAVLSAVLSAARGATDWPAWRGPLASGASPDADPPLRWDARRNRRWRTELPGRGVSTPIVWRDQIFVTAAVETDTPADTASVARAASETPDFVRRAGARLPTRVVEFNILALRRADGGLRWARTAAAGVPHQGTHGDASWAAASPVTDGERLYVYFGSQGLHAYALDGTPLWRRDLGRFTIKAAFGEGVSPVICGDTVIVSQDHEGPGFIAAFDRVTGDERWRVPRAEVTAWATPLVVEHAGRRQIVVSATGRVRAYDAADGAEQWSVGGMTANVIPCPVADAERVYLMSGFRGHALLAVRLAQATGDVTDQPAAVAWRRERNAPYVPSPLLTDGRLYYLKGNDATLSCVRAEDGAPLFEAQPLEGAKGVYASPVAAAGRLYIAARDGRTVVLKAGPVYEVLAVNTLDDSFTASPALAGRDLFLRGMKSLYCLSEAAGSP